MKLLVIDVQKGITDDRLYNFKEFEKNIITLIDRARENAIEVIYVQHDDGPGTGFSVGDEEYEIYDKIKPLEQEKIYRKTVNSCFGNFDLKDYLKQSGEDILIIIGLQTDFCIDASVKSAFENGYKVIVPQGANSTFDNEYMDKEKSYRYYNEFIWPNRYAQCISVEETVKLMK
ncbi:MAG: cysteine hydrolase [Lachnospiraceae bacterium]|nr:cysteine hydrolase [Lachnospiraceae bacterium]